MTRLTRFFGITLALALLVACGGSAATPPLPGGVQQPGDPATPPAEQGGSAVVAAAPTADPQTAGTPLPEVEGYYVAPEVPSALRDAVEPVLIGAGLAAVETPDAAIVRLVANPGEGALLRAQWVYTAAAPFATVPDGVAWEGLAAYWGQGALDGLPDFGGAPRFVLTQDAAALLEVLLGPAGDGVTVEIAAPDALTEQAWGARPAISVLPFEALSPRWKVLPLGAQSVLDPALDLSAYPLAVEFGLEAVGERGEQVAAGLASQGAWPETNRDPARITTLVMTGVTALVRATAMTMETRGLTYPADAIMSFFDGADILHTSNEVSFTAACPPPDWFGDPEGFCSDPRYMELLRHIGLDVVELTGNHLKDVGGEAMLASLSLYEQEGIPYYGGGHNVDEARAPLVLTAPDGTRIAFVGCNDPGPPGVFAGPDYPGAAACDEFGWMVETIRGLKESGEADVVIASVQYWELPLYEPSAEQVADFTALAEAGADIVSGSQAHQPQGFAFVGDSFVHYGVGNLFFDQMDYIENRQMFADRHVLYEGRHISTVLFTGLMEDWAQPNPMTPDERTEFLRMMFEYSGW